MSLVEHARKEMEILGCPEEDVAWMCKVIGVFAEYGHSGSSASYFIPMIYDLLQFKNLSPLTDDPHEWIDHGDCCQNTRRSDAFSEDGGKTYYLLSEDRGTLHTSEESKNGTNAT